MIAQEVVLIEHFHKTENDVWIYENYNDSSDVLRLEELELELSLEKLYDRVEVVAQSEEDEELFG